MKPAEESFPVMLFIITYKVNLIFKDVYTILKCDY